MRQLIFFIIFSTLISCSTTYHLSDNDDMYIHKRDTVLRTRIRRESQGGHVYFTPNYGYYGWGYSYGYPYQYYQSRTIIIVPNNQETPNYGKRPSREEYRFDNRNSNRRGRN